jgi:hypothetical protein
MPTFHREQKQSPDGDISSHPRQQRATPGRDSWERPLPRLRRTPASGSLKVKHGGDNPSANWL